MAGVTPAAPQPAGPDEFDRQVAWLLAHPGTSAWLKAALRSAEGCDPVSLLNDLELLRVVLGRRAEARVSWPPAPP